MQNCNLWDNSSKVWSNIGSALTEVLYLYTLPASSKSCYGTTLECDGWGNGSVTVEGMGV